MVRINLRSEGGFGLIELLLAMLILNIGLLAVVASFTAGMVSLRRAGKTTTAAVLADWHMEEFRALKYSDIALASARVAGPAGNYTDDPAWSATMVTTPWTVEPPYPPNNINPFLEPLGADGDYYRVNTYIVSVTPTGGRPVKKVTIVVRDRDQAGMPVLARQVSTFDQSTG